MRPELEIAQPPIRLPARVTGAIRFDGVTFAYPARPETLALGPVSFTIDPGERVALVGPSGAGKTTILSLLLRFYDPQAGSVRIGGTDLREFDPAALRQLMAVVPQDPVIFAASALDNVRYGRPGASREEAERLYAGEEEIGAASDCRESGK
jgi:ATP-binding cassette subfamily B protein